MSQAAVKPLSRAIVFSSLPISDRHEIRPEEKQAAYPELSKDNQRIFRGRKKRKQLRVSNLKRVIHGKWRCERRMVRAPFACIRVTPNLIAIIKRGSVAVMYRRNRCRGAGLVQHNHDVPEAADQQDEHREKRDANTGIEMSLR